MTDREHVDRPPDNRSSTPLRSRFITARRVSLLCLFWHTVTVFVWMRERIHIPRWLGGDSREVAVRLWTLAWLTFVWVLLWGTVSWANILAGLVVAIAVVTLLPLPRVPVEGRIHPIPVVIILVRLVIDFFVSSAQVAWAAIRPGKPPLGAVIRVRVAIKSDMVLTLAVDYLNLVPGTMVLDIDHRRRILYVHVFDVRTEKKVQAFYDQVAFVERSFIRAFERDSEWHPSPYHGLDDEYHRVHDIGRAETETTTIVDAPTNDGRSR